MLNADDLDPCEECFEWDIDQATRIVETVTPEPHATAGETSKTFHRICNSRVCLDRVRSDAEGNGGHLVEDFDLIRPAALALSAAA